MRAVWSIVGVVLVAAGCADNTGGTAAPAPDPGASPSSTAPTSSAPTLIMSDAVGDGLLKPYELGEIVGDTETLPVTDYTDAPVFAFDVDSPDCGTRLLFIAPPNGGDYAAVSGNQNRGARGQTASQLITIYSDRDRPSAMLDAFGRMFTRCADGQRFQVITADLVAHWTATAITTGATVGGGAVSVETPTRTCYHAIAARANATVESIVCGDGDSAAQANAIVDRIVAKLPE